MYRVLLVEDDAAMRYLYRKMNVWEACGFEIAAEASNGKKALEILETASFDLILTDIRMPLIDGIELLRILRERSDQTLVVFSSSYSEFEYARQGLLLGAFDYLVKPADQAALGDMLTRIRSKLQERSGQTAVPVAEALAYYGVPEGADPFLEKLIGYFSAHYKDSISLEDIAADFAFNKDYFGKLFRQHTGVHFHEFLTAVKICYAKELLRSGNYKAYEVSEMIGYTSVDYFTKKFKEITGTTPSKFRTEGQHGKTF